jgi:hypothetical protein
MELSVPEMINRQVVSRVPDMSSYLTRKGLYRSVVGAVALLVLACAAMFGVARLFVV